MIMVSLEQTCTACVKGGVCMEVLALVVSKIVTYLDP